MQSPVRTPEGLCCQSRARSGSSSSETCQDSSTDISTDMEDEISMEQQENEPSDKNAEPLLEDITKTLIDSLSHLDVEESSDQWPCDNEDSFMSRAFSSNEYSDDNLPSLPFRQSDGECGFAATSDSNFQSDSERDTLIFQPNRNASDLLYTQDVVQSLQGGTVLFENELFEVRSSAIGGVGAFAKRPLNSGDVILVEQPLFMSDEIDLFDDFRMLDHDTQKVALSLHKNELLRGRTPNLQAVWSTNSFATKPGVSGLFAIAGRFNHACHPGNNADFVFDQTLESLTLTIRQDNIKTGEELTICYGQDRSPRILYLWYGFRCCCGSCPGLSDEEFKELTEPW